MLRSPKLKVAKTILFLVGKIRQRVWALESASRPCTAKPAGGSSVPEGDQIWHGSLQEWGSYCGEVIMGQTALRKSWGGDSKPKKPIDNHSYTVC